MLQNLSLFHKGKWITHCRIQIIIIHCGGMTPQRFVIYLLFDHPFVEITKQTKVFWSFQSWWQTQLCPDYYLRPKFRLEDQRGFFCNCGRQTMALWHTSDDKNVPKKKNPECIWVITNEIYTYTITKSKLSCQSGPYMRTRDCKLLQYYKKYRHCVLYGRSVTTTYSV